MIQFFVEVKIELEYMYEYNVDMSGGNVIILGSVDADDLTKVADNYPAASTALVFAHVVDVIAHKELLARGYSWFTRRQMSHAIIKQYDTVILIDCGAEYIRKALDWMHPEQNYLQLLRELLIAPVKPNRTGIPAHSVFNREVEFSLMRRDEAILPLLTTKRVPLKAVYVELLWFLSGAINTDFLRENGVKIWDGNTSREYLDSRGLTDYEVGEVGATYGYQWRNFGGSGVDQIKILVGNLRADPFSRRHVVSAWNPTDLPKMCLEPCHYSFVFVVDMPNEGSNDTRNILNCKVIMRSTDTFLGLPFNIASYSILTHMLAKITDMRPGKVVITMCDVHLYTNHVQQAREQITRSPRDFPKFKFASHVDQYTSLDDFKLGDIEVQGYDPCAVLQAPMAV
ncbi:thymidylate synthase [Faustovirus]|nr:thymidylate synthase [Faustovirus]AMN84828.1 thymidylate synthase [Faustovirus]AMP44040.1 thymidylate synthase [Faustovirus]